MHWFTPAAKAVARLAARHKLPKQLIKYSKNNYTLSNYYSCTQIRWVTMLSGFNSSHIPKRPDFSSSQKRDFIIQKRDFIGVGDGEEGNVLSKVYDEKRVLGYSPEQLFAVVAAVDLYEGFLPWCQRSEILRRFPDGSFEAELEIGFKFLVESYVSHVELRKPNYVKTSASQSNLFDHLINIWQFNPGPVPGSCQLYFHVDFKFRSPFYHQIANMFFNEVVARLVGSFDERCRLIYGPGVPVEKLTEQTV